MLFSVSLSLLALLGGSHFAASHPLDTRGGGGPDIVNNCTNSGQLALTFNDGPWNYEIATAKALDGNKGTFFLNGNNYVCIYDRVDQIRQLYEAGHVLGSCTWSHADLTTLDESGINEELAKFEDALIKILGVKPTYFRPPYGAYNDLVLSVLAQRGYTKLVNWSEDTGESEGQSLDYAKMVLDNIAKSYPAPHLVLSYSTNQTTPDQLLPSELPKLEGAGYQIVDVPTCLGFPPDSAYVKVGGYGTPDESWHC